MVLSVPPSSRAGPNYPAPGISIVYHSVRATLIILTPLAAAAREAGVAVRRDADLDGQVPAAGRQVSCDWSRHSGAEL